MNFNSSDIVSTVDRRTETREKKIFRGIEPKSRMVCLDSWTKREIYGPDIVDCSFFESDVSTTDQFQLNTRCQLSFLLQ